MVTSNADYCRKGSESPETSRRGASSGGSKDSGDTPTDIGTTIRRKLARSATLRHPGSSSGATNGATGSKNTSVAVAGVKGAEMSVCRDCRAMIVSIIKSSRSSGAGAHALALTLGGAVTSRDSSAASSPGATARGGDESHGVASARAALRNFRLELKPVYKAS